jgi:hypothetical protein
MTESGGANDPRSGYGQLFGQAYGAGQGSAPDPAQRKRPSRVWVASILLVVFGIIGLGAAWLLLSIVNDDVSHGESAPGFYSVLAYIQLALAVSQILSGILVWAGLNWGRILAIVLCSVNILGAAANLFTGNIFGALVGIVLNIALIVMLNRDEVADWCQPAPR